NVKTRCSRSFPPFMSQPTAQTSPLSLHDALPIFAPAPGPGIQKGTQVVAGMTAVHHRDVFGRSGCNDLAAAGTAVGAKIDYPVGDRKSTRLNSSHVKVSYAVFCLKKKRRACIILQ